MTLCLRGWNATFADRDSSFPVFVNSQAQFNLTIPASYVPGDPFTVTFTGGLASEDVAPASVSTVIGVGVFNQVGGLPLDIGPFSDTGLTYAIGNTFIRFQPSTAVSWTVIGPGDAISAGGLGRTNISANILVDGSPTAPGEGAVPSFTAAMLPVGWFPSTAFSAPYDIPDHTVSLSPGDVAAIQFFTQSHADDVGHPTRSFYPYITSITVDIGAESLSVPLASVKTGFHLGAATAPWQVGGADVAPWNAYGLVSASKPPQAGAYQDMWLAPVPVAHRRYSRLLLGFE